MCKEYVFELTKTRKWYAWFSIYKDGTFGDIFEVDENFNQAIKGNWSKGAYFDKKRKMIIISYKAYQYLGEI